MLVILDSGKKSPSLRQAWVMQCVLNQPGLYSEIKSQPPPPKQNKTKPTSFYILLSNLFSDLFITPSKKDPSIKEENPNLKIFVLGLGI